MLGSLTLPSQIPFTTHRRLSVRAAVSEADRKSLYEVLRVKRNASPVEIKTAYRTLAKLYHPDAKSRFMDSPIAKSSDVPDFIEIHEAYATLSDPNARAVYDSHFNVDTGRVTGLRSPGRVGFYQTRRWETDQCW